MKKEYKIILITLSCVILQSLLYLLAKNINTNYVIVGNDIDNHIPFISYSIIPYAGWYILLFVAPLIFYKSDKTLFIKYTISYLLISVLADIIFIMYPTYIIRPVLANDNIINEIINLIYKIDTPALNCLPSLHCAVAFTWVIYFIKCDKLNKYLKLFLILFSLLVIPCTLFIKQHVFIDAVLGVLLSIIVMILLKFIKINYNKVINLLKI